MGLGDVNFIQQLLNLDSNPLYFKNAFPILSTWENTQPHERNLVRMLYAEIFRGFKGFRPAFEWASLYSLDQLPVAVVELFELIHGLLKEKISTGKQIVLT